MRIFGRELTFKRAPVSSAVSGSRGGGWFPWVHEPYTGAWQKNDEWRMGDVTAHYAVYACVTLIANDIGKLRQRLMELDADGIWLETTSPSFSPVLRKPNGYQNHIQFKQWWQTSKLTKGNAYGLKQRDNRGIVTAIYLLDPDRVTVLVADNGDVYYQCNGDDLNELGSEGVTVPASEMIHDRMNCLFHPLVGVSPLYACALAACQSLKMQNDSSTFFENGARPGGILSAPGAISDETAARLKAHWDSNYTGQNAGKVAVVGDDLKFQQMKMSATDSQLVEQFRLTAEMICTAFHVPPSKVGIGSAPAGSTAAQENQKYYDDCIQILCEEYEACMDDGLALPDRYGVELDINGLLRMDRGSQVMTLTAAVKGSIMTTNEGRRELNLPPVEGGDVVTAQQQDFSLAALAKRDANDPFATPAATQTSPPAAPTEPAEPTDEQIQDSAKLLALLIEKRLANEPA
ncbi:phage portal protein [Pseudomonas tolaasii]